jgi:hypothetical protein
LDGQTSDAACLDCPPGKYCETAGLTYPSSTHCPAGFYCPDKDTEESCEIGYMCPEGIMDQVLCQPGLFYVLQTKF